MSKKTYYYLDKIEEAIDGEPVMPVTCEIDVSNLCQLNCSFCMYKKFRRDSSGTLNWSVYVKLVQDLKAIGARSITFTGGGEPLTHPNFHVFAEIAKYSGFEIGLITNGLYLHKNVDPSLFKFIRVSLDAASRGTYSKVKGYNGFDAVCSNIKRIADAGGFIGISFVVCEHNRHETKVIGLLGQELGAAYVQIKPAWINGNVFSEYTTGAVEGVIRTDRGKAADTVPCAVASLVGVVAANGDVYYCCQHRGNPYYKLGNLKDNCFPALWETRPVLSPKIEACPMCRYVEYANSYKALVEEGTVFFSHRNFL